MTRLQLILFVSWLTLAALMFALMPSEHVATACGVAGGVFVLVLKIVQRRSHR